MVKHNSCALRCSMCISAIIENRGADKSLARPDWKKNNWKFAIFRPARRSLLPWRPGWTDNLLNCFWVTCKSYSLVAVACFLPGRAKDLSALKILTECYMGDQLDELQQPKFRRQFTQEAGINKIIHSSPPLPCLMTSNFCYSNCNK
jgi:hypothetical protein